MKKYNLIVAGGGFAGLCAAIAAARQGLSVLLFDKSNCLGGTAVNCLVLPFMNYYTTIDGKKTSLSQGIFKEIVDELKKFSAEMGENKDVLPDQDFYYNEEHLKIVLNRMVLTAGVELLFHTYLLDAQTADNTVTSIRITNKSGIQSLSADYFIDATGDANLAAMCDFPYHVGREEDGLCQPMTLCFRVGDVDVKTHFKNKKSTDELYKKFREEGLIKNPREDVLTFHTPTDSVVHFNSTRIIKLNPTDANDFTKAEIEAREQVVELLKFLKENIAGFENAKLLSTAMEIGVRESRMIDGEYTLTGTNLRDLVKFDDSIALGNYDIDIHNPSGSGTSHYYFKAGEFYTIPYRSLIPKNSKNLLVAGRCISTDHEAQASIRIMPIVACIGEAAGTAIAVSAKNSVCVAQADITTIRETLQNNGAVC